jgi:RNA polymerase sigma-70 factor (ECF subfamily)
VTIKTATGKPGPSNEFLVMPEIYLRINSRWELGRTSALDQNWKTSPGSIYAESIRERKMTGMLAATAPIQVDLSGMVADPARESVIEANLQRRQEFETILPRFLPRFRSMATHWLGNREDAEDAVQDAMLSAFTHIASFNGRAKLSTWLTAIVINAVRMQIRRRPRVRLLSMDYSANEGQPAIAELLTDPRPTPEKTAEQIELYQLAMKLTQRLPRSQRAALRIHQQSDFSIRKAAQKLGVPEGTLKAQLARGRAKLAERFRNAMAKPKTKRSRSALSASRRSSSFVRKSDHAQLTHLPIAMFAEQSQEAGVNAW